MCDIKDVWNIDEGRSWRKSIFVSNTKVFFAVITFTSFQRQTQKVTCIPPGAGWLVILLINQGAITQRNRAASPSN